MDAVREAQRAQQLRVLDAALVVADQSAALMPEHEDQATFAAGLRAAIQALRHPALCERASPAGLAAALITYRAQHHEHCDARLSHKPCSCGLDALLKSAEGK